MTIGTFVLVGIFLHIVYTKKTLKKIFISWFIVTSLFELLFERGYFLQLATIQISYRLICELFLALLAMLLCRESKKISINRHLFFACFLMIISILIGLIMLTVFPTSAIGGTFETSWEEIVTGFSNKQLIRFNSGVLLEVFQLALYITVALVVYSLFTKEDWQLVLLKFIKYSKLIIYANAIEIPAKYILHSNIYSGVLDMIFGVSRGSFTTLYSRDTGYALWGTTNEASHYAFVLAILFFFYFADYLNTRSDLYSNKSNKLVPLVIIVIEYALMMSFSVIYFVMCILLLLFLIWGYRQGKDRKLRVFMVAISMVIGIVLFTIMASSLLSYISTLSISKFFTRRLASLGEEIELLLHGNWLNAQTALEWSNRVRLGSTVDTIKLLIYRPLFGLGYASVTAHSSLAMLLTGCGVIGSIIYLNVFFWMRKIHVFSSDKSIINCCCFIYLLINFLNSMSLRPFYECWTILLIVAFQYLAAGYDKKVYN